MAKSKSPLNRSNKFRARAELLIRESEQKISRLPAADMFKLVHELHVHEMELEMQNEELRRVQMELEASRDRFSTLYDFSPVGYFKLNADGLIREANLTAARQFGINRINLIGKKLSLFLAPDSRNTLHSCLQRLSLSETRQICELKFLKPRGGVLTGRLEGIALSAEPAGPRSFLVALSDISEQLHSEAARAHLVAIVDSSNDAIISCSLDHTIASWNHGAEIMFGYSGRQIIGRPVSLLVPLEYRENYDRVHRQIQRGERVDPFNAVRLAKGERRIHVSITVSPIKNISGGILGISKIIRDISRQRQAEEALQRSERDLVDFFNEAPLGLLWVRKDGQIQRMNRAQSEMLGHDAGGMVSHPIFRLLADEAIATDLLDRLARGEIVQNYRARFRHGSGSLKHVLIDANGLWQNRRLVHSRWFVRDITRYVELEREILAISEREQRRIGQDLHDDLGQQLAGIEFAAQSLARQLSLVSRSATLQAREMARMVQRAMSHTRELARGLSPVNLETDGLKYALQELARNTEKIFRIDCYFSCKRPVLIEDQAVGIHLYRIAQEAVNNAIKHGKARRIDIGLSENAHRIMLAVSDDGIGMPTRPRKQKGMGLRVMQYRAGVIGGSLVAQRQPNGGMTFVCSIKKHPKLPAKAKKM